MVLKWSGPRFRLRTLIAAVACFGIALGIAKWLHEWPTRLYLRAVMQSEALDEWDAAHKMLLHGPDADPAIAVPALINALGHRSPRVRASAARALGSFRHHQQAQSAIPSLIGLLKDEDAVVRSNAAATLGWICIDPVPKEARLVSALKSALGDDSVHVRMAAAGALFRIGEVEATIPALTSALVDESEPVRLYATLTLGGPRMVNFRSRVLPALRTALRDRAARVRVAAAGGLLSLGDAEKALPVLAAERDNPDDMVRRHANEYYDAYLNK
jgi:HEAT repeat protein